MVNSHGEEINESVEFDPLFPTDFCLMAGVDEILEESSPTVGNVTAVNPSEIETEASKRLLELQRETVPDEGLAQSAANTWYLDSGCSRHMTGNKDLLYDVKTISHGGPVAFGGDVRGGRIIGNSLLTNGEISFDKVNLVSNLKFNLLSVSQICENKMPMFFDDCECYILKPSFKIPEDQILFLAKRKGNMYALDMSAARSTGSIACFLAKASEDDSTLWHRRMGHVNFRNMNRLVRGKYVDGVLEKEFIHIDNCVACLKCKQHKTSHMPKPPGRTTTILQQLHLDLFGPVSIKSLGGKSYCLVITDDYSRYSWVFFLKEKSETAEILKDFVKRIENRC